MALYEHDFENYDQFAYFLSKNPSYSSLDGLTHLGASRSQIFLGAGMDVYGKQTNVEGFGAYPASVRWALHTELHEYGHGHGGNATERGADAYADELMHIMGYR